MVNDTVIDHPAVRSAFLYIIDDASITAVQPSSHEMWGEYDGLPVVQPLDLFGRGGGKDTEFAVLLPLVNTRQRQQGALSVVEVEGQLAPRCALPFVEAIDKHKASQHPRARPEVLYHHIHERRPVRGRPPLHAPEHQIELSSAVACDVDGRYLAVGRDILTGHIALANICWDCTAGDTSRRANRIQGAAHRAATAHRLLLLAGQRPASPRQMAAKDRSLAVSLSNPA